MSDPLATRNADEVVLVVSPGDFASARCVDWLKRFNLPESTPVWVDPCVGAGSVYAMKIIELLRNRWQDFSLRVDAPENAE